MQSHLTLAELVKTIGSLPDLAATAPRSPLVHPST